MGAKHGKVDQRSQVVNEGLIMGPGVGSTLHYEH